MMNSHMCKQLKNCFSTCHPIHVIKWLPQSTIYSVYQLYRAGCVHSVGESAAIMCEQWRKSKQLAAIFSKYGYLSVNIDIESWALAVVVVFTFLFFFLLLNG